MSDDLTRIALTAVPSTAVIYFAVRFLLRITRAAEIRFDGFIVRSRADVTRLEAELDGERARHRTEITAMRIEHRSEMASVREELEDERISSHRQIEMLRAEVNDLRRAQRPPTTDS